MYVFHANIHISLFDLLGVKFWDVRFTNIRSFYEHWALTLLTDK